MPTLEEKLNELKQKFTETISLLFIPSTQKQIVIPTIIYTQFTEERLDITKRILKQYNKDINFIIKFSGIIGVIKLIRQLFRIRLSQNDISIILEEIIEPFKVSEDSSQMYLNTLENFKKIADFRIMYLITEREAETQKFNAVIYKEETKEIIPIDNFLKFCFLSNTIHFWFRIIIRESIIALKKILDIAHLKQVEIPNYSKKLSLKLIDLKKLIENVPLDWFHPKAQERINELIIKYKEDSLTKKEKELEEIEEFSKEEEPEWKEEEAKGIPELEEPELEEPELFTLEEIKAKIEELEGKNIEIKEMLVELTTDKGDDISTLKSKLKLSKEEKALMKLYKRELSVIKRYSEIQKELKERINIFKKEIDKIKKDEMITDSDRIIYTKRSEKLFYAIFVLFQSVQEMYHNLEGGKPFGLDPTESANAGLSLIAQTLVDLKKILDNNKTHKNYNQLKGIFDEYLQSYEKLIKKMEDIRKVDALSEMPKLIDKIKIIVIKLDSELTNFNKVFI